MQPTAATLHPASAGTPSPTPDLTHPSSGFLQLLDKILRQRDQLLEEIMAGNEVRRQLRSFLFVILVLSAVYGMTMGTEAMTVSLQRGLLQLITSALKVPLLYLLSLLVCFPVLFIVLVLMGARLRFGQTLALILLAVALNSVLLVSCAPIILFFTFTGSNYHFVKLLHVAIFSFSGFWGMLSLWQGLRITCEKSDLYPKQSIRILKVWVLIFGFVGTQVAWSLRPFVGDPGQPYQLFRQSQASNFYEGVWKSVLGLRPEGNGRD